MKFMVSELLRDYTNPFKVTENNQKSKEGALRGKCKLPWIVNYLNGWIRFDAVRYNGATLTVGPNRNHQY